jgi:DDE superfamily endonuclease
LTRRPSAAWSRRCRGCWSRARDPLPGRRLEFAESRPYARDRDDPGRARLAGAGPVHDKKAKWIWGVPDELEKAGLVTLADKGYQGSTWAKVPYEGKGKPEPQKEANRAHARLRAPASERSSVDKSRHATLGQVGGNGAADAR